MENNEQMITTIYGDMDECLLCKKEGAFENDNEITSWVEYYLDGELVHRSAGIYLKKGFLTDIFGGSF
jgi:hypothetical protein